VIPCVRVGPLVRVRLVVTVVGVVALGCGGDAVPSGNAAPAAPLTGDAVAAPCASFTPCGGSLVGRWKATNICVSTETKPPYAAPECATSTVSGSYSGTFAYDFRSDGALGIESTLTMTTDQRVTDACIQAVLMRPIAEYCDALGARSGQQCQLEADACSCQLVQTMPAEMRTYEVMGNQFRVSDEMGFASPLGFCVSGNVLDVGDPTGTTLFRFARE
jgi:hypothetical protein